MNDVIRILFVDDDEDELILLQDLLNEITEQHYAIDWAPSYEKAIEKISSPLSSYDICIIDYRLGIYTGLDLLKYIHDYNPNLPIILFTGQGDSRVDIEAMKAGASDYLIKGKIDSNLIERSIRYSINKLKTQQQLIDQEKNLREIEKFAITGRIALVIAHEVRNPLTNVKLALYQLRDEIKEANESISLLFNIAERNCDRINHLITNLLESTKFSELKFEDISINKIVEQALDLASDRIELKGVKIIKRFSPEICDVYIDKEKIEIAFLNIILNAVEAVEKDKGIITVTTRPKDGKCEVIIKDNGKGIDSEQLNMIFEPYFTNKEGGMGLGLTTTQTIIYNHKGTINVESRSQKGTSFIITIEFSPHKL
ncbi:MAG: response regulator [Chitinophagales bacterium]|nr:response regulator [Chitinophagales bacterium]